MDSPYDAPAKPLLRQLRLPSIVEMISHESASMVYNAMNGQAPAYLSSPFNSISAVTNRVLHNSNLSLWPPRMKTKFGQNSFVCRRGVAAIWNSLLNDCRTAHTFPTFNVKLKAMLAQHHLFISLGFVLLFLFFSVNIIGLYSSLYIFSSLKGGPLENQLCLKVTLLEK